MKLRIDAGKPLNTIPKEIYGHFSEHLGRCIYEGIYVGENSSIPNTNGYRNDVIEAFKQIKMPVLRWPGGCFADEYHWKDGIGEKSERKRMINTHWGGVVEDNSFGTHEFMNFCELIGCEPYIAGNLGSGTVQEMSEWVEYMTFDGVSPMAELRRKNGREKPWKLKYFGVGNENWGCGGNMRAEYYADLYRRYQTYCRDYSGNSLYKVACGPSGGDYDWTRKLLSIVKPWHTKAISMHYYTIPSGNWDTKGSATVFTDEQYYDTLNQATGIKPVIEKHLEIMSEYDKDNQIGLIVDEWGTWYDVEEGTNPGFLYQQNTMRDAMVAAVSLDIFNAHSDRIVMANIAQAVNVLQAVILTEGERMVKTPTYHVFDMYKYHQQAELLSSECENKQKNGMDMITQTASLNDGTLTLTISNLSLDETFDIDCDIDGFEFSQTDAKILTAEVHSHNTFDNPENVSIKNLENITKTQSGVKFALPPCSVVCVRLK